MKDSGLPPGLEKALRDNLKDCLVGMRLRFVVESGGNYSLLRLSELLELSRSGEPYKVHLDPAYLNPDAAKRLHYFVALAQDRDALHLEMKTKFFYEFADSLRAAYQECLQEPRFQSWSIPTVEQWLKPANLVC